MGINARRYIGVLCCGWTGGAEHCAILDHTLLAVPLYGFEKAGPGLLAPDQQKHQGKKIAAPGDCPSGIAPAGIAQVEPIRPARLFWRYVAGGEPARLDGKWSNPGFGLGCGCLRACWQKHAQARARQMGQSGQVQEQCLPPPNNLKARAKIALHPTPPA